MREHMLGQQGSEPSPSAGEAEWAGGTEPGAEPGSACHAEHFTQWFIETTAFHYCFSAVAVSALDSSSPRTLDEAGIPGI